VRATLALLLSLAILLLPRLHARAEDGVLLVEWTDYPVDRNAIFGDPLFQRTLRCRASAGPMACELTTVQVSRGTLDGGCPLSFQATVDRTGESLRVSRRGDALDVEASGGEATLKLRVRLAPSSGSSPIVLEASGVLVSKLAAERKARPVELTALVKRTDGMEKRREFVEVDLRCSKASFVAAKSVGR
jgi:hypothetical protein